MERMSKKEGMVRGRRRDWEVGKSEVDMTVGGKQGHTGMGP